MTLLSICTNACNNIGITAPSTIIGNTDPGAQRLLQMARREGQVLSTRANWTALNTQYIFVADGTSDYTLPSDFRSMIGDTLWDRTRFWKMRGAMSPQQWQMYKSSIIGRATIERRWRIRMPSGAIAGAPSLFSIDPAIESTNTTEKFVFEYVSNNWCRSTTPLELDEVVIIDEGVGYAVGDTIALAVSGALPVVLVTDVNATGGLLEAQVNFKGQMATLPGSPVSQSSTTGSGTGATFLSNSVTFGGQTHADWTADTDTALLDEDLIELGVIWRTLRRMGLAYDEELNEYNNQVTQAVARDGGNAVLSLAPYDKLTLVGPYNIQEGNFPS